MKRIRTAGLALLVLTLVVGVGVRQGRQPGLTPTVRSQPSEPMLSPVLRPGHDVVEPERAVTEARELAAALAAALDRRPGADMAMAMRRLRQACPGEAPACLRQRLSALSPKQQVHVQRILTRLPVLEERLGHLPGDTRTPFQQRLAEISRLRQEVLGAGDARLVYGREEARLSYQAALDEFLRQPETARMSLVQRLAERDRLQQRFWQEYRPEFLSAPDRRNHALSEELALALLDAGSPAAGREISRTVRTRYLGPEAADRLYSQEAWQETQDRRMADYGESRAQILAQTPSGPVREQRLAELRERLFGRP